jgi:hypothetical protein
MWLLRCYVMCFFAPGEHEREYFSFVCIFSITEVAVWIYLALGLT